jgi:hypothetical protein
MKCGLCSLTISLQTIIVFYTEFNPLADTFLRKEKWNNETNISFDSDPFHREFTINLSRNTIPKFRSELFYGMSVYVGGDYNSN